jgi:hypothetical protein
MGFSLVPCTMTHQARFKNFTLCLCDVLGKAFRKHLLLLVLCGFNNKMEIIRNVGEKSVLKDQSAF